MLIVGLCYQIYFALQAPSIVVPDTIYIVRIHSYDGLMGFDMIGVHLTIRTHIFTGVLQDSDYIIEVIAINGIGGNTTMKFLKGIIIYSVYKLAHM